MQLQPGQWYCDTCGEVIYSAEEGYLEWKTRQDEHGALHTSDLHLVHHKPFSPYKDSKKQGCYYDDQTEYHNSQTHIQNASLADFAGPDGLIRFLDLLVRGDFPKDELVVMMQRVLVPGYECARPYFQQAIAEGIIEPDLPENIYWPHQIDAVIQSLKN